MRLAVALLSFLALPSLADAAPAEDQTPILRCFVVAGLIAKSNNPEQAQAGRMAGVYWMGRLDSSLSEAEIEQKVRRMSETTRLADLQPDVPRCAAELKARVDMMKRVGDKVRLSAPPAQKR